MAFLKRFLRRKPTPAAAPFTAPISPDSSFYVIADIHGRDDLLCGLLDLIQAEATDPERLVFVGDYIDRGEDSARVLRRVYDLQQQFPQQVTCLMGNHEDMMLRFLDNPQERGPRWLRYGGLQTLASLGIGGVTEHSGPATLENTRDALAEALGADLIEWLQALPVHWQSGNVAVVHAGADPRLPMADQEPRALKWGHPDFRKIARTDGIWIVHGHTIVDEPHARDGRISIDTGAYATGRLTAAHVRAEGLRFIQT